MAVTKRIAAGVVAVAACAASLAGCGAGTTGSSGAKEGTHGAKKAAPAPAPKSAVTADRRRLHRVHRSPALPAQARAAQARPEAAAVRRLLLGRRGRGQPAAVLPLPQGGQGQQGDDDVLPERRVPAPGGQARPLPAAPALAGPLRHRLQRRAGHRRHREAAAARLAGGQRDRHPLQRPLLRQRRRGRRVVGRGLEGRDRPGETFREVLEDHHGHEEGVPAALRLREGTRSAPARPAWKGRRTS